MNQVREGLKPIDHLDESDDQQVMQDQLLTAVSPTSVPITKASKDPEKNGTFEKDELDRPIENENPQKLADDSRNKKVYDVAKRLEIADEMSSPIECTTDNNSLKNGSYGNKYRTSSFSFRIKGKGKFSILSCRKRRKSTGAADSEYVPPYKIRYRRQQSSMVLPSKFLLGGNINDPLNLASLCDPKVDEELNRQTPKSSPIPIPEHKKGDLPVMIPKNVEDPLGLQQEIDSPRTEDQMIKGKDTRKKKPRKNRNRSKNLGRKRTVSECTLEDGESQEEDDVSTIASSVLEEMKKPKVEKSQGSEELNSSCDSTESRGESSNEISRSNSEINKSDEKTSMIPAAHKKKHLHHNHSHHGHGHGHHRAGDPIVSPVVPQPGTIAGRRRLHHQHSHHGLNNTSASFAASKSKFAKPKGPVSSAAIDFSQPSERKKYKAKDEMFQYGNYTRYYGYRTSAHGEDARLWILKKEWFHKKDVLDIGCNIGHITLSIARDFDPMRIVGIDIDNYLINVARKNVKHYMTKDPDPSHQEINFPHSLSLLYGVLQSAPCSSQNGESPFNGLSPESRCLFPGNVSFKQENYVLQSDSLLDQVVAEFDVILALSITKWIHLNFGDAGIKRFFRRAFRHLRPGGKFILEPQPWSSYSKKKKLTESIARNYKEIRFFPNQFEDFLMDEVGFSAKESVGTPAHTSKGFQRPLIVFSKSEESK